MIGLALAAFLVQMADLGTYLLAPQYEAGVVGTDPRAAILFKLIGLAAVAGIIWRWRRYPRWQAGALIVVLTVGTFGLGTNIAILSVYGIPEPVVVEELPAAPVVMLTEPDAPEVVPAAQVGTPLVAGRISQAVEGYGPDYLAVRAPVGTRVEICGLRTGVCYTMRSTSSGPSRKIRPLRIADLALVRWRDLCGLPDGRGVCRGSIEFLGGPKATAPPTDIERNEP
jgi:hypothetical protein